LSKDAVPAPETVRVVGPVFVPTERNASGTPDTCERLVGRGEGKMVCTLALPVAGHATADHGVANSRQPGPPALGSLVLLSTKHS
jgi:hypothetical protein